MHGPKALRDKLQPKAKAAVFIGYSSVSKAYMCLDLDTGKTLISPNVVFHEQFFPYKHATLLGMTEESLLRLKTLQWEPPDWGEGSSVGTARVGGVEPVSVVSSTTNLPLSAPHTGIPSVHHMGKPTAPVGLSIYTCTYGSRSPTGCGLVYPG